MFAKAALILTLVMSLCFSTQVSALKCPAGIAGAECAKMECSMGCCCANKACCAAMRQNRLPQPIQRTSAPDFQIAAMKLRDVATLYFLPPAMQSFAIRHDARAGHTPPLLAVNCIRLI